VSDAPAPAPAPAPFVWRRWRGLLLRLGGLTVALGAIWLVLWRVGWLARISSLEQLRTLVASAGPVGWIVYALAFALGEVVYLPAMLFVGVAATIWPKPQAFALAYASGLLSCMTGFGVGRLLGTGLNEGPGWLRRLDQRLQAKGVRTVVFLRLVFWLAPFVNMGLGLTRVKARDYFLGTVIGTLPPILLMTTIFHDTIVSGHSPASLEVGVRVAALLCLFVYGLLKRRSLVAPLEQPAPLPPPPAAGTTRESE
jgi:uncharacterized membrane protein YdjX (TVP38/TMEM64 family)